MSDFQFMILVAMLCYLTAQVDRAEENKPVFLFLTVMAVGLALFCAGFQP